MLEIKLGQFEMFWFFSSREETKMTLTSKYSHETNKDECTCVVGRCHCIKATVLT